jgi:hypothetical protein
MIAKLGRDSKAPNSKLQAPKKFQAPIFNAQGADLPLTLDFWWSSGGWMLELGASAHLFRRQQARHQHV